MIQRTSIIPRVFHSMNHEPKRIDKIVFIRKGRIYFDNK